jgi:hypothetical protein
MAMQLFPLQNKAKNLVMIPTFNTTIINYGNRVEQRIANQSLPQYKFTVTFVDALTFADIQTILTFFVARKGAFEAFYFPKPMLNGPPLFDYTGAVGESGSDPVDNPYVVRFETDLINAEFFQFNLATFQTVNLVEVLA